MENKYNPTRKEVLSEIPNGVRNTFTKENLHKTKKSFNDFLGMVGGVGGILVAMPYAIPTITRTLKREKGEKSKIKLSLAENIGGVAGMFGGFVVNVAQAVGYIDVAKNGHSEYLLIPVTTNVASGLYEIGRKMYGNAKQRLLDKQSSGNLEASLETK